MACDIKEKEGLVYRALAKANGADIHDVRVLCGYYRSAISIYHGWKDMGLEQKAERRRSEIAKYEQVLEHIARTGSFPEKE